MPYSKKSVASFNDATRPPNRRHQADEPTSLKKDRYPRESTDKDRHPRENIAFALEDWNADKEEEAPSPN
ncbi:hypothetical protein WOLCODRAFT_163484 [Wolfiporia cocos MD-104 SS10]|uniref:Uncharacterized protein n=1 Tax=Wolfiporia cocos (strain MD-104) TaxID=742152 RepID=A0A2H3JKJ5_WOLCO|nr:hypothetical protein WOLCODRAFT_163484 [Wolfiporia cocos MD-104 SS10]